jgi:flagellar biosynthesis/type III secretory pathway protein FliH
MKRLACVSAFGFFALALGAPTHAQTWAGAANPSYAAERQSYVDARRAAFDNGYREGLRLGERDGRRGAAFHFQNERTFQRADRGYHRSFGDIERYRQAFRSGYSSGYRDGYERFARNIRGPVARGPMGRGGYPAARAAYHPAAQGGFDDGYEKGLEDARKNRSFDVLRHKWYRSGDRHYQGRYGSREQYKDIYREAFKSGYERGYREGRWR